MKVSRLAAALAVSLLAAGSVRTAQIEGVDVPAKKTFEGRPLARNGVGVRTKVHDDGACKSGVASRDFQRAFLSMWFGSKPVLASLKADLLGE